MAKCLEEQGLVSAANSITTLICSYKFEYSALRPQVTLLCYCNYNMGKYR